MLYALFPRLHRNIPLVALTAKKQDVRVGRLIDIEQQRLKRLQASIDQDTPSTREIALAFLGTAAGKTAVASRLAMAPCSSESEAEAKREIVRLFVRREQASLRHDFNAVSPPPSLRCPRSDRCDATFVDRGHCLRHAADVHPADAIEVAELSAAINDAAGLEVFEHFVGAAISAESVNGGRIAHLVQPLQQEMLNRLEESGENDDSTIGDADINAARDTLEMWKAIEEWRAVTTTSPEDRYRKLGVSIIERFGSGSTTKCLPDDIRVALGGEKLRHVFGKLGEIHRSSSSKSMRNLLGSNRHHRLAPEQPAGSSSDDHARVGLDFDPFALEEASSRAVVFLGESPIGRAFLRSVPYRKYLDRVHKPMRDAVSKAAADIAVAETAKWAAEAAALRKAALDRKQEVLVGSLADQASSDVLEGAAGAGLLGGVIDDLVKSYILFCKPFRFGVPFLCLSVPCASRCTVVPTSGCLRSSLFFKRKSFFVSARFHSWLWSYLRSEARSPR